MYNSFRHITWRADGKTETQNQYRARRREIKLFTCCLQADERCVSSVAEWVELMDLQPQLVPGFKSRPSSCRLQPLASRLHTCASVTKQYNLVPAQVGKVTVGRAWHRPCVTNSDISALERYPVRAPGVVRIDPLRFLQARCRTRRLNRALSVLSVSLDCCAVNYGSFCVVLFVCSVSWLFLLSCQYQCKWLTGKTRLRNDL